MLLLQQRLAATNLGQTPRPRTGGGIIGKIAGGISAAVPGTNFGARFFEQLATGLILSPAALFYLGKAAANDVRDVANPDFWMGKGEMNSDLARFFGDIGEGIVEDVRHPLQNPGYLALDVFGAASLGAGAAARLGRASRAVGELGGEARPPLLPPGADLPPRPSAPPPAPPVQPAGPRGYSPAAGQYNPTPIARATTPALQKSLQQLAYASTPEEAATFADRVLARISIEKPTQEKMQGLMDQVAPRDSPQQQAMHEALVQSQARRRQAQLEIEAMRAATTPEAPAAPRPVGVPTETPFLGEQIPGQQSIPGFHESFNIEQTPGRIREDFGPALSAGEVEATDFVNQLVDDPMVREAMAGAAPEETLASMVGTFHDILRDPARIQELREASEKMAGIKQQRQQLAREATGSVREAKNVEGLLEEVGFRPLDIPQVSEIDAARRFPARTKRDPVTGDETIELYDRETVRSGRPTPSEITVRSTREIDRPTPVVPVAHIDPQTGQLLRAAPSTEPVYRVLERGTVISDPIVGRKNAVRLAQMHALERAKGIDPAARGLSRGDEPIGELGPQASELAREMGTPPPILARDALAVAREQVARRKQTRKASGVSRAETLSEEDAQAIIDESAGELTMEEAMEIANSPRTNVPADTPIEETPPVDYQAKEHLKSEAPEEISRDIDVVYEELEKQNERQPKRRQFGESDRQLGINPRALDRAGLSREQGNALRGPLREMREKYGSKMTNQDVQDVIAETLHVTDDEALRIFNDLHGVQQAAAEIKLRPGSLKSHFKELWGLTDEQATQAAERFKEEVSPYMQRAKAEGRSPKREDLLNILKGVFGPERGTEAFKRLYDVSGGASATSVFFRELFRAPPKGTVLLSQPADIQKTYKTYIPPTSGKGKYSTKTYSQVVPGTESVAVDLSRNPVRAGFQRWYYNWLNQAPATGRRAKLRARKIKFEKGEIQRIEKYLEEAGMTPEEIAAARQTKEGASFGDYVDTMNQLAQIGVLYLKPAYIPPNLLGQILFTTIDHTWNPIAIARSFKLHSEFARHPEGRNLLGLQRAGMGEGIYESIRPERGAVKSVGKAHGLAARAYGRILDVPFRDAAFTNEARKMGYGTADSLVELLKAKPGSDLYQDLITIFKNANRNMVDYGRLSSTEKLLIRRVIFFYPWIKGSTIWAGRAISEHPGQMLFLAQAGRQSEEKIRDVLGPVPSYMRGVFPVGERDVPGLGKMPRIINPTSFSVTGSAGEFISAVKALAFGGTTSEQLSEYFTPGLSAALAASTRTDPFTGKTYNEGESPLDIFTQEMTQSIPLVRALRNIPPIQKALGLEPGKEGLVESGEVAAEDMLMPTTRGEELGRFGVGLWPVTYNIKEGQSRAAAESQELRGTGAATDAKWAQTAKATLEAAQSAGALRKGESFPAYVTEAVGFQAKRDKMYEALASSMGRNKSDLNQIDKLQADLQVIIQSGKMSPAQAQQLLLQYSNFDDTGISYFRRKLADTYFGLSQLYAYRRTLVARGVDSKVLNDWNSP